MKDASFHATATSSLMQQCKVFRDDALLLHVHSERATGEVVEFARDQAPLNIRWAREVTSKVVAVEGKLA
jgi:hypothetical protein